MQRFINNEAKTKSRSKWAVCRPRITSARSRCFSTDRERRQWSPKARSSASNSTDNDSNAFSDRSPRYSSEISRATPVSSLFQSNIYHHFSFFLLIFFSFLLPFFLYVCVGECCGQFKNNLIFFHMITREMCPGCECFFISFFFFSFK